MPRKKRLKPLKHTTKVRYESESKRWVATVRYEGKTTEFGSSNLKTLREYLDSQGLTYGDHKEK